MDNGRVTRSMTLSSNKEVQTLKNNFCDENINYGKTRSHTRQIQNSMVNLIFNIDKINVTEPIKFEEAWNHPDIMQREKWQTAIKKEFEDLNKRNFWRIINKHPNMRTIKLKRVFKIKSDSTYRARLCALGYMQVSGLDYSDIHSPVLHEVTFRIMLVYKIINNFKMKRVDVTTAFLESKIKSVVLIDLPEGLEKVQRVEPNTLGQLNSALHGLPDSARSFYELLKLLFATSSTLRRWRVNPVWLNVGA